MKLALIEVLKCIYFIVCILFHTTSPPTKNASPGVPRVSTAVNTCFVAHDTVNPIRSYQSIH